MILNKDKLLLIKTELSKSGIYGSIVVVFNNIENKTYYYLGDFHAKNPSDGIHHHSLKDAVCLNFIFDNIDTFFSGEIFLDTQTIINKINSSSKEFYNCFLFDVVQL